MSRFCPVMGTGRGSPGCSPCARSDWRGSDPTSSLGQDPSHLQVLKLLLLLLEHLELLQHRILLELPPIHLGKDAGRGQHPRHRLARVPHHPHWESRLSMSSPRAPGSCLHPDSRTCPGVPQRCPRAVEPGWDPKPHILWVTDCFSQFRAEKAGLMQKTNYLPW